MPLGTEVDISCKLSFNVSPCAITARIESNLIGLGGPAGSFCCAVTSVKVNNRNKQYVDFLKIKI